MSFCKFREYSFILSLIWYKSQMKKGMKEENPRLTPDGGRGEEISPPLVPEGAVSIDSLMKDIAVYLKHEDKDFSDRVQLMLFRICADKYDIALLKQVNDLCSEPATQELRYTITQHKLTDFAKVIWVLCELHIFSTPDGRVVANRKELFNFLGDVFGVKLNNYSQLLNSAKQGSKDFVALFRHMLEIAQKFNNE